MRSDHLTDEQKAKFAAHDELEQGIPPTAGDFDDDPEEDSAD